MPTLVRDVMTTRIATIGPDVRLETVARAFERHPFHHLPVVDPDGKCIGIVSDRDLTRCVTSGRWDGNKTASAVMTQMLVTVPPEATIHEAAQRLLKLHVNSLLILDEGNRLKGIVTTRDLVRALANEEPQA